MNQTNVSNQTNLSNQQINFQLNNEYHNFNPFQMRNHNLDKFKNDLPSHRLTNHEKVLNRAKCGTLQSSSKSLDILRATLQSSLNEEINGIMQKYFNQYFKLAIQNIKSNNGDNSIQDYDIQLLFAKILEEAKKMYGNFDSLNRLNTPTSNFRFNLNKRKRLNSTQRRDENNFNIGNSNRKPQFKKRLSTSEIGKKKIKQKESSELRKAMLKKRKLNNTGNPQRGRPPLSTKNKLVDLGEDNFNPERITVNTKFVLGSKANKALGFGAARGRLYTKHTDLFRYVGDPEDKQYLHEKGLFPISGARAFLIIKEDIEKILASDEYLNAPGVDGNEMGEGFQLPEWIINKIKNYMVNMKSERDKLVKQQDDIKLDEKITEESIETTSTSNLIDNDPFG